MRAVAAVFTPIVAVFFAYTAMKSFVNGTLYTRSAVFAYFTGETFKAVNAMFITVYPAGIALLALSAVFSFAFAEKALAAFFAGKGTVFAVVVGSVFHGVGGTFAYRHDTFSAVAAMGVFLTEGAKAAVRTEIFVVLETLFAMVFAEFKTFTTVLTVIAVVTPVENKALSANLARIEFSTTAAMVSGLFPLNAVVGTFVTGFRETATAFATVSTVSFKAVVTHSAHIAKVSRMFPAPETMYVEIITIVAKLTFIADGSAYRLLTLGAMVLFVAVTVGIFRAMRTAVAKPVVKSVTAAKFTFGAVFVAGIDLPNAVRYHAKQHEKRKHKADRSSEDIQFHFFVLHNLFIHIYINIKFIFCRHTFAVFS